MIVTPSYSIPKGVNSGVFSIPSKFCKEVEDAILVAKYLGYQLPTDYQLRMLSFYINEQKLNGIWERADLVYLFGYNNLLQNDIDKISDVTEIMREQNDFKFCDINLKNPSKYLGQRVIISSNVNCHHTNRGLFKAIGTNENLPNEYLTGYDPSIDAVHFELNSASVTAFIGFGEDGLNASNNSTIPAGIVDNVVNTGIRFNTWNGVNNRSGVLNNVTPENYGSASSNQNGYHHFERTASNALAWYLNSVSVQTRTGASTAIQAGEVRLVRRFSNTLTFFRLGASLGSTLQKIDYQIFTEFKTKLGL